MKKTLLIIALFLNLSLSAQMAKLGDLSSSEFLNSKIIYEDNNKDIYGYFLLYQKDRKDKDVYEFEYALMDKNLNKMASGSFFQSRYTTMLIEFNTRLLYVKKSGDMLYFSLGDIMKGYEGIFDIFGFYNLRSLSLTDFKVSEQQYIKNMSPILVPNQKLRAKEFQEYNYLKPTNNNGFVVFDESVTDVSMRYFMGKSNSKNIKQFKFLDLDLKEKWTYNYDNGDAKSFCEYNYYTGDKNDMIFRREFFENPKDEYREVSFEFIDAGTGAKKFDIVLKDDLNQLNLRDIKFEDQQVIFYLATNDKNDKNTFYYAKITGYMKLTFDRNTGKEIDRKYFKWGALSGQLDIDEFGKIKDYGYIHFLDYNRTSDGKTIVIGEGFAPQGNSKILDLFTFVFDADMKLVDYHKVEKFQNTVKNLNGYGSYLESYGAFDFMYSQNLPSGGYVFYYMDNEKKSKRSPAWILGVVTYVDGVFDFQKVTLTTKEGQIYPMKAKNGYILLMEDFEKDSELRLEKINY